MTKFKKVLGDAKVFYRILPSENPDWENMRISQDKKAIQIHYVGPRIEKKSGQRLFKQFETDGILVNISQNDVYTTVMDGVLESVFQGQNAIIVSFGQTGSGKSLTVGGLHFFYQDRGLIPRSIENIFRLKEQLPKHLEMEIEISYIEIMSMAQAHDLLKPYPAHLNKNNIKRTLKKLKVCKDLEALQIVFMAEGRKEYTCDTNYPSHVGSSIFTFHFTLRNMDFSDSYRVDSKLHIIDLAGNDCFGDKSSRFKDSWQVGVANRTKSYIEHFMLLLCGNDLELQRVQERTNIISEYLSNTFSRHSLLRFIGHLKSEKNIDPHLSISMLRFGQMVKNLKPEGTTVSIKPNELKIADTLQVLPVSFILFIVAHN
ncbi:hypothetical protein HHI36_008579 [Cryptolaemus montrouzieri]|uniref:Kinesin motor domain-containing protein n=1 Tax=Cryptolaemus montrouzieri TaxID=559131 RepID=A0ABD2MT30_9CUCU